MIYVLWIICIILIFLLVKIYHINHNLCAIADLLVEHHDEKRGDG